MFERFGDAYRDLTCHKIIEAAVESLPMLDAEVADEFRSRLPLLPSELHWMEATRQESTDELDFLAKVHDQMPDQLLVRVASWIRASSQWAKPMDRALYGDGAQELLDWILTLQQSQGDRGNDG